MKDQNKPKEKLLHQRGKSEHPLTDSDVAETRLGRALAEMQDARRYAQDIVETVREPLLVLDADLKVLSANRSFYIVFRVEPGATVGSYIYDLGNRQWDIPGLGLSIAKTIIEAHGGRIWAESVPAKYTVFSFTLPKP
jgi:nitrogen-specific signal transduction histidine kinase